MAMASLVLAEVTLESLIWWLIIGLIAGFLASMVMRGGVGYGILGDIVAGLVGAFIGGWLFGMLGINIGNGQCAGDRDRRLSEEITVPASHQQSTAPDTTISTKSSHAPFWSAIRPGTALIGF